MKDMKANKMELYKKYRPKTFKQFYGNKTVIQSLKGKVKENTIPHTILFTGPTGCGKTTIPRILARILNCTGLDYKEIDSGVFRGIDTVRDLRKEIFYKPIESPCKITLIDECHMMGVGGASMKNPAQNALLKILEDTPAHAYIFLSTTDPQMLIKPIVGRCTQYNLEPLQDKELLKLLKKIIRKEKKEVPNEVLDQIILDSLGHPRNALQILEKVIDLPKNKMLQAAKENSEKQNEIIVLSRALLKGESWAKISEILKSIRSYDPELIRRNVLGYMEKVLLNNTPDKKIYQNAAISMNWFEEPTYNIGFPGIVLNCHRIINGD